jgi:carboxypeptidase C (cathepsin A)
MELDTLGIINGCIDIESQIQAYPQIAFNNTYRLQIINDTEFEAALSNYPDCQNLITECRSLENASDPQGLVINATANAACATAFDFCFGTMWDVYNKYGRNVFDIELPIISSWTPKFAAGYLNRADVQQALGVWVNFTGMSIGVDSAFRATGDFVRAGNLQEIGALLDRGVKVALMYGDKDYQCNCMCSMSPL